MEVRFIFINIIWVNPQISSFGAGLGAGLG